ncbi:MAG TPA: hypothetical protein VN026_17955 [Bacteroidia bacterium]|jgi:hypothetical protein|nr:hypothetical protein [Bacteroidia bacterium]
MNIGNKITLKGISKHGKDRIHQFGNCWIIKCFADKVGFDDKKGNWIGLIDANGKNDFRWVHETNDKNFMIV